MSQTTILHTGCKANIYLDILGRRDDGYHELRTLFLPLPKPHDTLTIKVGSAGTGLAGTGLRLKCLGRKIDTEDNILLRAYKAFTACNKTSPDLEVCLIKRVPIGAGLGGGSSNAAAFLIFLNQLSVPSPLSDKQLHALAASIGADVPFFLYNRPAWAEGIGDILHPADISLAGLSVAVACPDIQVSTAWAYQAWDKTQPATPVNPKPGLLTALGLKDIVNVCPNLFFYNCFERVVFSAYPHLRNIKENLLIHGAAGVALSGSGASIVAVFRNPESLESASHWMRRIGLDHYKRSFEKTARSSTLGRRQAVRHGSLESAFGGSNPPAPAIINRQLKD